MNRKLPEDLLEIIAFLKKLPGVGSRTAERFAFEYLSWPQESLSRFGDLLKEIKEKIPHCSTCGCLTNRGECTFCDSTRRECTSICLLGAARDVYAIEETRSYRGLYHVVEHLLSPLDGRNVESLRVDRIAARLAQHPITEVIIAFDSTLEGDTTALYLKNALAKPHLSISRLAFGLPLGSSLEYIDGGTLARALQGRQVYSSTN